MTRLHIVSATGQRPPLREQLILASRTDPAAQTPINWYPLPQELGATNNFIYNSPANQSEQKVGPARRLSPER